MSNRDQEIELWASDEPWWEWNIDYTPSQSEALSYSQYEVALLTEEISELHENIEFGDIPEVLTTLISDLHNQIVIKGEPLFEVIDRLFRSNGLEGLR